MEPAIASGHKTRRTRPTDLNRLKYKINHNDILNQLNRNKFILNKLTSSIRRDKKTNKQKKTQQTTIYELSQDDYGELSNEYLITVLKSIGIMNIPPPPGDNRGKSKKTSYLIYPQGPLNPDSLNNYILQEQIYRRLRFEKLQSLKYASEEQYVKIKMAKIAYVAGKYILKLTISYFLGPMILNLFQAQLSAAVTATATKTAAGATSMLTGDSVKFNFFSILLEQVTNYQFSGRFGQKILAVQTEMTNIGGTVDSYFKFGKSAVGDVGIISDILKGPINENFPLADATSEQWKIFIFKYIIDQQERNKKTPSNAGKTIENILTLVPNVISEPSTGLAEADNIIKGVFSNFEDVSSKLSPDTRLFGEVKGLLIKKSQELGPSVVFSAEGRLSYFINMLTPDEKVKFPALIALAPDLVALHKFRIPGFAWSDIALRSVYEIAGEESSDTTIFSAIGDSIKRDVNQSLKRIIYGNKFKIIINGDEGRFIEVVGNAIPTSISEDLGSRMMGNLRDATSWSKWVHDDVGINMGNFSVMILDSLIDQYVNPYKTTTPEKKISLAEKEHLLEKRIKQRMKYLDYGYSDSRIKQLMSGNADEGGYVFKSKMFRFLEKPLSNLPRLGNLGFTNLVTGGAVLLATGDALNLPYHLRSLLDENTIVYWFSVTKGSSELILGNLSYLTKFIYMSKIILGAITNPASFGPNIGRYYWDFYTASLSSGGDTLFGLPRVLVIGKIHMLINAVFDEFKKLMEDFKKAMTYATVFLSENYTCFKYIFELKFIKFIASVCSLFSYFMLPIILHQQKQLQIIQATQWLSSNNELSIINSFTYARFSNLLDQLGNLVLRSPLMALLELYYGVNSTTPVIPTKKDYEDMENALALLKKPNSFERVIGQKAVAKPQTDEEIDGTIINFAINFIPEIGKKMKEEYNANKVIQAEGLEEKTILSRLGPNTVLTIKSDVIDKLVDLNENQIFLAYLINMFLKKAGPSHSDDKTIWDDFIKQNPSSGPKGIDKMNIFNEPNKRAFVGYLSKMKKATEDQNIKKIYANIITSITDGTVITDVEKMKTNAELRKVIGSAAGDGVATYIANNNYRLQFIYTYGPQLEAAKNIYLNDDLIFGKLKHGESVYNCNELSDLAKKHLNDFKQMVVNIIEYNTRFSSNKKTINIRHSSSASVPGCTLPEMINAIKSMENGVDINLEGLFKQVPAGNSMPPVVGDYDINSSDAEQLLSLGPGELSKNGWYREGVSDSAFEKSKLSELRTVKTSNWAYNPSLLGDILTRTWDGEFGLRLGGHARLTEFDDSDFDTPGDTPVMREERRKYKKTQWMRRKQIKNLEEDILVIIRGALDKPTIGPFNSLAFFLEKNKEVASFNSLVKRKTRGSKSKYRSLAPQKGLRSEEDTTTQTLFQDLTDLPDFALLPLIFHPDNRFKFTKEFMEEVLLKILPDDQFTFNDDDDLLLNFNGEGKIRDAIKKFMVKEIFKAYGQEDVEVFTIASKYEKTVVSNPDSKVFLLTAVGNKYEGLGDLDTGFLDFLTRVALSDVTRSSDTWVKSFYDNLNIALGLNEGAPTMKIGDTGITYEDLVGLEKMDNQITGERKEKTAKLTFRSDEFKALLNKMASAMTIWYTKRGIPSEKPHAAALERAVENFYGTLKSETYDSGVYDAYDELITNIKKFFNSDTFDTINMKTAYRKMDIMREATIALEDAFKSEKEALKKMADAVKLNRNRSYPPPVTPTAPAGYHPQFEPLSDANTQKTKPPTENLHEGEPTKEDQEMDHRPGFLPGVNSRSVAEQNYLNTRANSLQLNTAQKNELANQLDDLRRLLENEAYGSAYGEQIKEQIRFAAGSGASFWINDAAGTEYQPFFEEEKERPIKKKVDTKATDYDSVSLAAICTALQGKSKLELLNFGIRLNGSETGIEFNDELNQGELLPWARTTMRDQTLSLRGLQDFIRGDSRGKGCLRISGMETITNVLRPTKVIMDTIFSVTGGFADVEYFSRGFYDWLKGVYESTRDRTVLGLGGLLLLLIGSAAAAPISIAAVAITGIFSLGTGALAVNIMTQLENICKTMGLRSIKAFTGQLIGATEDIDIRKGLDPTLAVIATSLRLKKLYLATFSKKIVLGDVAALKVARDGVPGTAIFKGETEYELTKMTNGKLIITLKHQEHSGGESVLEIGPDEEDFNEFHYIDDRPLDVLVGDWKKTDRLKILQLIKMYAILTTPELQSVIDSSSTGVLGFKDVHYERQGVKLAAVFKNSFEDIVKKLWIIDDPPCPVGKSVFTCITDSSPILDQSAPWSLRDYQSEKNWRLMELGSGSLEGLLGKFATMAKGGAEGLSFFKARMDTLRLKLNNILETQLKSGDTSDMSYLQSHSLLDKIKDFISQIDIIRNQNLSSTDGGAFTDLQTSLSEMLQEITTLGTHLNKLNGVGIQMNDVVTLIERTFENLFIEMTLKGYGGVMPGWGFGGDTIVTYLATQYQTETPAAAKTPPSTTTSLVVAEEAEASPGVAAAETTSPEPVEPVASGASVTGIVPTPSVIKRLIGASIGEVGKNLDKFYSDLNTANGLSYIEWFTAKYKTLALPSTQYRVINPLEKRAAGEKRNEVYRDGLWIALGLGEDEWKNPPTVADGTYLPGDCPIKNDRRCEFFIWKATKSSWQPKNPPYIIIASQSAEWQPIQEIERRDARRLKQHQYFRSEFADYIYSLVDKGGPNLLTKLRLTRSNGRYVDNADLSGVTMSAEQTTVRNFLIKFSELIPEVKSTDGTVDAKKVDRERIWADFIRERSVKHRKGKWSIDLDLQNAGLVAEQGQYDRKKTRLEEKYNVALRVRDRGVDDDAWAGKRFLQRVGYATTSEKAKENMKNAAANAFKELNDHMRRPRPVSRVAQEFKFFLYNKFNAAPDDRRTWDQLINKHVENDDDDEEGPNILRGTKKRKIDEAIKNRFSRDKGGEFDLGKDEHWEWLKDIIGDPYKQAIFTKERRLGTTPEESLSDSGTPEEPKELFTKSKKEILREFLVLQEPALLLTIKKNINNFLKLKVPEKPIEQLTTSIDDQITTLIEFIGDSYNSQPVTDIPPGVNKKFNFDDPGHWNWLLERLPEEKKIVLVALSSKDKVFNQKLSDDFDYLLKMELPTKYDVKILLEAEKSMRLYKLLLSNEPGKYVNLIGDPENLLLLKSYSYKQSKNLIHKYKTLKKYICSELAPNIVKAGSIISDGTEDADGTNLITPSSWRSMCPTLTKVKNEGEAFIDPSWIRRDSSNNQYHILAKIAIDKIDIKMSGNDPIGDWIKAANPEEFKDFWSFVHKKTGESHLETDTTLRAEGDTWKVKVIKWKNKHELDAVEEYRLFAEEQEYANLLKDLKDWSHTSGSTSVTDNPTTEDYMKLANRNFYASYWDKEVIGNHLVRNGGKTRKVDIDTDKRYNWIHRNVLSDDELRTVENGDFFNPFTYRRPKKYGPNLSLLKYFDERRPTELPSSNSLVPFGDGFQGTDVNNRDAGDFRPDPGRNPQLLCSAEDKFKNWKGDDIREFEWFLSAATDYILPNIKRLVAAVPSGKDSDVDVAKAHLQLATTTTLSVKEIKEKLNELDPTQAIVKIILVKVHSELDQLERYRSSLDYAALKSKRADGEFPTIDMLKKVINNMDFYDQKNLKLLDEHIETYQWNKDIQKFNTEYSELDDVPPWETLSSKQKLNYILINLDWDTHHADVAAFVGARAKFDSLVKNVRYRMSYATWGETNLGRALGGVPYSKSRRVIDVVRQPLASDSVTRAREGEEVRYLAATMFTDVIGNENINIRYQAEKRNLRGRYFKYLIHSGCEDVSRIGTGPLGKLKHLAKDPLDKFVNQLLNLEETPIKMYVGQCGDIETRMVTGFGENYILNNKVAEMEEKDSDIQNWLNMRDIGASSNNFAFFKYTKDLLNAQPSEDDVEIKKKY